MQTISFGPVTVSVEDPDETVGSQLCKSVLLLRAITERDDNPLWHTTGVFVISVCLAIVALFVTKEYGGPFGLVANISLAVIALSTLCAYFGILRDRNRKTASDVSELTQLMESSMECQHFVKKCMILDSAIARSFARQGSLSYVVVT